ncbi:hypothetical protein FACS1894139_14240 [Planctomycetales bacterium]|nr:hypothetical protein FACS1894107_08680 [Planctomycetales bacterium]GHT07018.1 hypothetical protein FACS1894139_14240 [Planctomycetales bacterium]
MAETPPPTGNFWTATGKQLLPLIALVVGIKFFVADIYGIPTGSMEPTLHGREHSGDRIFCAKVNYYFRTPRRWEVFVFKFPYEESRDYTNQDTAIYRGEYFIKRCVGLPGEEVFIAGGDIFTRRGNEAPRRQVKDDATQRPLWLPVYDEDFRDLRSSAEMAHYWSAGGETRGNAGDGDFSAARLTGHSLQIDGALTLTFRPRTHLGVLAGVPDRYVRRQYVTYQCPRCGATRRQTVTTPKFADRCGCRQYLTEDDVRYYDFRTDYPPREIASLREVSQIADPSPRLDDWHYVADLREEITFKFAAGGALSLVIADDWREATAEFTPNNSGGKVRLIVNGKEYANVGAALPPHATAALEFYRCDGEYRAFVNGEMVFSVAPDGHELNRSQNREIERSSVQVRVRGGGEISRLAIGRDIHYFNVSPLTSSYRLPADGYMALGDNSPSSNDSRNWGPVPQKNLVGPALAVWWPLDAARAIH